MEITRKKRAAYEWSQEEIAKAKHLSEKGYMPYAIADEIGRARSSVYGLMDSEKWKKPLIKAPDQAVYVEKTPLIEEVISRIPRHSYDPVRGHLVGGKETPIQQLFEIAGIPLPVR